MMRPSDEAVQGLDGWNLRGIGMLRSVARIPSHPSPLWASSSPFCVFDLAASAPVGVHHRRRHASPLGPHLLPDTKGTVGGCHRQIFCIAPLFGRRSGIEAPIGGCWPFILGCPVGCRTGCNRWIVAPIIDPNFVHRKPAGPDLMAFGYCLMRIERWQDSNKKTFSTTMKRYRFRIEFHCGNLIISFMNY